MIARMSKYDLVLYAGQSSDFIEKLRGLGPVCRKLAIVLDRLCCLRVTIHADVSNLCGRDELKHALHHTKSGS